MNFDINRVKIVTMLPSESIDKIRTAICEEGVGVIGNYTCCTTSTNVIGTFVPGKEANPYIGGKGKLECVNEIRLEVVCDVNNVKKVISKLRKVHPYEEPEIDIIPLLDENSF